MVLIHINYSQIDMTLLSTFSRSESLSTFKSCLGVFFSVIDLEGEISLSSINGFLGEPTGAVIQ